MSAPRSLRPRAFRRCEENQHGQVLDDIVETVFEGALHEDHPTGPDRLVFRARPERGFTADDIVYFVLGMWLLRVGLPDLQMVDAHAERRSAQELQPGTVAAGLFSEKRTQVKDLHESLSCMSKR